MLINYSKLRKVRFEGLENLIEEGPVIIIGNHTHWTDPVYLALSYRKRFSKQIYFMAKEELFRSKFFRVLLNKVGAFPISRVGNDLKAMKTALRHLKNKDIVGIFPEGTRYHNANDEPLADFKQGAVVIAYRGGAPVIPCAIENASNFLKISKPAPIIRIGKPIYFDDVEGKTKQEVIDEYTEICKKGILELFE